MTSMHAHFPTLRTSIRVVLLEPLANAARIDHIIMDGGERASNAHPIIFA
jgi:hypothetical protein